MLEALFSHTGNSGIDSESTGNTVLFNNESTNAQSYIWKVNGQALATSIDFSYTSPSIGNYQVTLVAPSDDDLCYADSFSVSFSVRCGALPNIGLSGPSIVQPGDTLHLTSQEGPFTLGREWYVDGAFTSSAPDLNVSFAQPGVHTVALNAIGTGCSAQKETKILVVEPCGFTPGAYQWRMQGPGQAEITGVAALPDGSAVCTANGENLHHYSYFKLDKEGELVWAKQLESIGGAPIAGTVFNFKTILPMPDGGFLLAGDTDGHLMRTDSLRNPLWFRTVSLNSSFELGLKKILPLADDNFLLGGDASNQAFIGKIDADGNLLWSRVFAPPTTGLFSVSRFGDVEELTNGSLMLSIYYQNSSYNHETILIKTDAVGNMIWSKAVTNPGMAILQLEVEPSEDDGFYLGGRYYVNQFPAPLTAKMILAKADPQGNVLWQKAWECPGYANFSTASFRKTVEGDFLFFSTNKLNISNPQQKVYYFKASPTGEVKWSKLYDHGLKAWPSSFEVGQNGEAYIAGRLGDGPYDYFLLKADSSGNAGGCFEESHATQSAGPVAIDIVPFDVPTMSDGIFQNFPVIAATWSATGEWICGRAVEGAIKNLYSQTCLDSIKLMIEVCNNLGSAIKAETPITLYAFNPLIFSGNPLTTFPIGSPIPADSCFKIGHSIPNPQNLGWVYAVLNDDGTHPTPFQLDNSFDPPVRECSLWNNMDSVEIQPYIPPSIFVGNDTLVCPGMEVQLSASAGLTNWQWQDGTAGPTFTATQPGTYWVQATDACVLAVTDTVVVGLMQPPLLNLGNDVSVCMGQVHTFTVPDVFSSYIWQDGFAQPSYTAWQPGTLWLTATDQCGSPQTDTVQLTWDAATVIDLGENITACEGDTVWLEAPSSFETYSWSPPGLVGCPTCPAVVTASFPSIVTYSVLASNGGGCFSSDTVQVTVLPTAETFLTLTLGPGDTAIVGTSAYTATGQYLDTLTAANGCDSIVHLTLTVLTGTDETGAATGWHVFPNPSGGQFQLNFGRPFSGRLACFNALGEQAAAVAVPEGAITYRLDFQHFAKGVYFLRWSAEGFVLTKKIVLD